MFRPMETGPLPACRRLPTWTACGRSSFRRAVINDSSFVITAVGFWSKPKPSAVDFVEHRWQTGIRLSGVFRRADKSQCSVAISIRCVTRHPLVKGSQNRTRHSRESWRQSDDRSGRVSHTEQFLLSVLEEDHAKQSLSHPTSRLDLLELENNSRRYIGSRYNLC